MTREQTIRMLISVIEEFQERRGLPESAIAEHTIPMEELHDFDSLSSLEATLEIERRIGKRVPPKERLFFADSGQRYFTIGEIADRITPLLPPEGNLV